MKAITGYMYIDEKAEELKNQIPQHLQEELIKVYRKIHSAGVDEGYSHGRDLYNEHKENQVTFSKQ